jgi:hypothetical protein
MLPDGLLPTIVGILPSFPPHAWATAKPPNKEQIPMLTAAINFWLLPAELFFNAFAPAPKPVMTEIIPLASAGHRIRRRHKVIRSKRGD